MGITRDVSIQLDAFSQNPGAVLVRGQDLWYALEPAEPGLTLVLNTDGMPEWATPSGGNGVNESWSFPTLLNGWVNHLSIYGNVRYRKTAAHTVIIEGLAADGATGSDNPIFILPDGYRPEYQLMTIAPSGSNYARLIILPTGELFAAERPFDYISIALQFSLPS